MKKYIPVNVCFLAFPSFINPHYLFHEVDSFTNWEPFVFWKESVCKITTHLSLVLVLLKVTLQEWYNFEIAQRSHRSGMLNSRKGVPKGVGGTPRGHNTSLGRPEIVFTFIMM